MVKSKWLRILMVGLVAAPLGLLGCAGDDGDDGNAGADGADGNSVVSTTLDVGDENCPAGGTMFQIVDSLGNPVGDPTFVCNAPGSVAGPLLPNNESCNVCHGVGQQIGLNINTLHPLVDPKVDVANIVVASVAGVGDTVTFDVFQPGTTTPVPGLTIADFRFYIADIVPAGTLTANTPVATWATPYVERWLYERNTTVGAAVVENAPGNYTYTFTVDIALGGAAAPEFNVAHTQRLMIRVGDTGIGDEQEFSREAAIVEFVIPADGANTGILSQDETSFSRAIVPQAACTQCHGDPLQSAAHGSSYQTPQGCVVCHTPIGTTYGDAMQASGFWLASLIHGIHDAQVLPGWPDGNDPTDFSEVTYPQDIRECGKCHIAGSGLAQADNWKTNPTIEACNTCHDVNFATGEGHGLGGTQVNGSCTTCHPADGQGIGGSVSGVHAVAYDLDNQAYDVTISLSADVEGTPGDGVYEVGDTILVTVTTTSGIDYTSADTAFLRSANLYVYGPRAKAVPVLTPGSTTDPDFALAVLEDPTIVPDQGRVMLASAAADDPLVLTDATGFKYQLLEITEDMAAGTYMVQTNLDISLTGDRATDGRHIGPRLYPLDGWQLVTFQVKTATPELKAAGECTDCHEQRNFSTYAHRSYFGTDGCNACHDQSGNHADPLTNRVHAVHAASTAGDLTNVPGEPPTRDWSEITFPRNLNASCAACHNSGNNSHRTTPAGSWGYACIGCHAEITPGAFEHMEQMGAPFPTHVE